MDKGSEGREYITITNHHSRAHRRCCLEMFKAGLCEAHYHEHKRNLVDHGRRGGIGEGGRKEDVEPEKPRFFSDMMLLKAKAKKEEEQRRKDREAQEAFRITQEERRAAMERIKARCEGSDGIELLCAGLYAL